MSKDTELAVATSAEAQEKLKLWNSVEKTPPKMTKHVKMRGGFTTVDPQYQLLVATSLWGPYGQHWGMRNLDVKIVDTQDGDDKSRFLISNVFIKAEFYYPVDGKEVSFEIWNDEVWRPGDDTIKKLMTNTRSKALSWLGFSADVFLGKFDDANYVKDLNIKFEEQDAFVTTAAARIRTAKDLAALKKCEDRLDEVIADQTLEDVTVAQGLRELVAQRKRELTKPKEQ